MTQRRNSRRSGAVAPLVAILMVCFVWYFDCVGRRDDAVRVTACSGCGDAAPWPGLRPVQNYKTRPGSIPLPITAATQMPTTTATLNDASGSNPMRARLWSSPTIHPQPGFFKAKPGTLSEHHLLTRAAILAGARSMAHQRHSRQYYARHGSGCGRGTLGSVPMRRGAAQLHRNRLEDIGNGTLNVIWGDFIIDSNSSSALVIRKCHRGRQ